jgi:hypothetical protein
LYKKQLSEFRSEYRKFFALLLVEHKYLSNVNNLSARLSCETPAEAEKSFEEIKLSIKRAQDVIKG